MANLTGLLSAIAAGVLLDLSYRLRLAQPAALSRPDQVADAGSFIALSRRQMLPAGGANWVTKAVD